MTKIFAKNGRKTVGICFCAAVGIIKKRGENGTNLAVLIDIDADYDIIVIL